MVLTVGTKLILTERLRPRGTYSLVTQRTPVAHTQAGG